MKRMIIFLGLMVGLGWMGCDNGGKTKPFNNSNNSNNSNNINNINNSNNNLNNSNNAIPICGNGKLEGNEVCDDANTDNDDGCTGDCSAVEEKYACPVPGEACVRIVVCGNGRIEGDETCDDANIRDHDGCDQSCHVEAGWICPVIGAACRAAACGDGIVAGFEQCDDADTHDHDGCSSLCRLEEGYKCTGVICTLTLCGDGIVEGTEECDDANLDVGDGCSPICKREPECTGGTCTPICGDGVVWASEECDDGNTFDGDGCSSVCTVEYGWNCVEVPATSPSQLLFPVTIRDFVPGCGTGARPTDQTLGAQAPYGHPDFECYTGTTILPGMVANQLDSEGKPVRVPNSVTYSDSAFYVWFRSNRDYNRTFATLLPMTYQGNGVYRYQSSAFFPMDGQGFVTETCAGQPCEPVRFGHNFNFTTHIVYWFQYKGTEFLEFTGDDDVWVFINERLAVDVGGVHPVQSGSVDLSVPATAAQLGLTVGGIYRVDVFHAERHTDNSNYMLTLNNFQRAPSQCASVCGDGIKASNEACDDGINDGSYGGCNPNCTFAPYCGDGHVDAQAGEVCDDGINLGGNASSCAPGCRSLGGLCGDGIVQTSLGEQCDDGNTLDGDGCTSDCRIVVD